MKTKALIRNAIRYVLDYLLLFCPIKEKLEYDIVIVRTDGIGDFILWLNTIESYKKKYAGKRVLLICPEGDVSVAKYFDFFTDIIGFNKRKLSKTGYHIAFMKSLNGIKAGILISPTWERVYPTDYIIRAIRSNKKIGIKEGKANYRVKHSKRSNHYYTDLINVPANTESEFYATEYFTRSVIDPEYTAQITDLSIVYKESEAKFSKYCVIALSSAESVKIWPVEKLSKVIDTIPPDYNIILSGVGKEDEQRARYIKDTTTTEANIIDYVNSTKNISELICLISHADFLIGYDSVAVHIAASCNVPSICIASGADFNRFIPYPEAIADKRKRPRVVTHQMPCFGCGYYCKETDDHKTLYCLNKITPEDVVPELNDIISDTL
jgi:ADP-heptose:LPS heptosyltransferase